MSEAFSSGDQQPRGDLFPTPQESILLCHEIVNRYYNVIELIKADPHGEVSPGHAKWQYFHLATSGKPHVSEEYQLQYAVDDNQAAFRFEQKSTVLSMPLPSFDVVEKSYEIYWERSGALDIHSSQYNFNKPHRKSAKEVQKELIKGWDFPWVWLSLVSEFHEMKLGRFNQLIADMDTLSQTLAEVASTD